MTAKNLIKKDVQPVAIAKKDDWISFMACGYLHYERVSKVEWDSFYHEWVYSTNWGNVREKNVKEIRAKK